MCNRYQTLKELELELYQPERRKDIRLQIRDVAVRIITLQPAFSLEKNVPNKLWMLYYKRVQARQRSGDSIHVDSSKSGS
jgi:hypothetical protein